ncbi:MAG TPA: polysaccharide deacetylase family protein [Steroidobacteraceae bacterium]|nr:polysaccharide deacetylase family protein [Steroidobacteraceae bacterium]
MSSAPESMKPMPGHSSGQEPWRYRGARAARGIAGLLRTRYPRFLFGLAPAAGEIPVFIFHEVETKAFTRQVEFLHGNGYRTLSIEEFLALASRKGGPRGGRQVLLTFDDARLNFHQTVLPVLRATGAHATLFAPTLWMDGSTPAGSERFMSWAQLRECVDSGVVDVASHAHRHTLVFDSDRLAGFATPWLLERYDIYDWPMRQAAAGERLGRPQPGTPIYDASPLLSARTRYLESEPLRTACTELVERLGGNEFFARPDCYSLLTRLHRSLATSLPGRFASEGELEALVASEFELSRAAFEQHLGFAPTAFAYPWALGSSLSIRMARRFGMRCIFGVATDYRRARALRRAGGEPRVFGRMKSDWLELLPGRNRARLLPVLARKVAAFAGQQHLAH